MIHLDTGHFQPFCWTISRSFQPRSLCPPFQKYFLYFIAIYLFFLFSLGLLLFVCYLYVSYPDFVAYFSYFYICIFALFSGRLPQYYFLNILFFISVIMFLTSQSSLNILFYIIPWPYVMNVIAYLSEDINNIFHFRFYFLLV